MIKYLSIRITYHLQVIFILRYLENEINKTSDIVVFLPKSECLSKNFDQMLATFSLLEFVTVGGNSLVDKMGPPYGDVPFAASLRYL